MLLLLNNLLPAQDEAARSAVYDFIRLSAVSSPLFFLFIERFCLILNHAAAVWSALTELWIRIARCAWCFGRIRIGMDMEDWG